MTFLGILVLIFIAVTGYIYKVSHSKPPVVVAEAPELPHDEPKLLEPVTTPTMPETTNREHLYDIAYASRGKDMSPLDKAPDNLACMESLDGVYFAAFGEHLLSPANRLSTNLGYKSMLKDPRLELIDNADALPGDMVISPTGYSKKNAKHGHCGIRGKTAYMSNDSNTSLWTANYNLSNWELVFHKTLGFPVIHFRVKGNMVK